MGSCVPKRDIPRFIGLYQRGKLPVQKLRSGFIGFEDINAGFDRLSDGAVLRQVLQPHAQNLSRFAGEVETRGVEGEGDRVGT
jgi:alcohol dehydrogenase